MKFRAHISISEYNDSTSNHPSAVPLIKKNTLKLSSARDLNSNVTTEVHSSIHFKWTFLHLLILSLSFHTVLNQNTSNKKYNLKNGSTYPLPKLWKYLLIFTQLSLGSLLNIFIFVFNFSLWNNYFKISVHVSCVQCATKSGSDCTWIYKAV